MKNFIILLFLLSSCVDNGENSSNIESMKVEIEDKPNSNSNSNSEPIPNFNENNKGIFHYYNNDISNKPIHLIVTT